MSCTGGGLAEEEIFLDAGVARRWGGNGRGWPTALAGCGRSRAVRILAHVVEVGGEVRPSAGEVDDLGLARRRPVGGGGGLEFGMLVGGVVAGVLDDALADAQGEIEATVGCVTLFEVLDDAEGVEVVLEAAFRGA